MKAASNVVLRRDLSLNRRLFGWLLGPGPEETHVTFFRNNVLHLLRDTLREDMFASPHPDSRPFKIFISLLDKWELGGPLVDVLLYDALKAVKRSVLQDKETSADVGDCRLLLIILMLNGPHSSTVTHDRQCLVRRRGASLRLETALCSGSAGAHHWH